jgi:hypothetical protein
MASAYDSPPPNPQITFCDDLTDPKQREAAERFVATHIAHSAKAAAQARAAEAERAKLVAALEAPFIKQIKEDPEASKALDELRTRQLVDLDSMNVLRQGEQLLTATDEDRIRAPSLREFTLISRVPIASIPVARVPPYDFTWSWFRQEGHPPFNQILDNSTGHCGLDARSGAGPGGAPGFVEAHAGFGVVLSTDRSLTARAFPFCHMAHAFFVGAVGIGANAVSEGGMDLAAFEENRLVGFKSVTLWRNRVSASVLHPDERARGRTGPELVQFPGNPGEGAGLTFRMNPGHLYGFNVGIWVHSDRSFGVGAGLAQALIEGDVGNIGVAGGG